MTYADIIVDISHEKLDKSFQYLIPPQLEGEIQIGMVVQIPFGRGNHVRKGYVVGISGKPKVDGSCIKSVLSIENDQETIESRLIALAGWMKEHYGSTMIQALKTVLPIQKKVKAQEKRWITLSISREEGEKLLEKLRGTRFKARTRLLEALLKEADGGRIEASQALKELGTTSSVLNYFTENRIVAVEADQIYRNAVYGAEKILHLAPDPLSDPQKKAVEQIRTEWKSPVPRPVLLHGVTGSGKTQVYMELIDQVIRQGRQAIVLIPEIALTFQTVQRFYHRFGDKVSIMNSRMSKGERYDQFLRAQRGDISVMIGPRSALFTPFSNLGLIIIDEEQEGAYNSEQIPRYHTRETAEKLAQLTNSLLLLGSATPSIEAFSRAESGEYRKFCLTKRAVLGSCLPNVQVVDMRKELASGNRSVFSRELREKMEECLAKKQQMMLFINRRGFSRVVSCRSCGKPIECPHCDVALTEHLGDKLVCHYCGYTKAMPRSCPLCGSPYLAGFGLGC